MPYHLPTICVFFYCCCGGGGGGGSSLICYGSLAQSPSQRPSGLPDCPCMCMGLLTCVCVCDALFTKHFYIYIYYSQSETEVVRRCTHLPRRESSRYLRGRQAQPSVDLVCAPHQPTKLHYIKTICDLSLYFLLLCLSETACT